MNKAHYILSPLWFLISLFHILSGFYFIYSYSTPGTVWLSMFPEFLAFTRVYTGLISLIFAIAILKKRLNHLYLVNPFTVIVAIFILVDLSKLGKDFILLAGSNVLILILCGFTLYVYRGRNNLDKLKSSWRYILTGVLIGLSPYLFPSWIGYDLFEFLH